MRSGRLKTNRSPDRRGTCSPLTLLYLSHSLCLSLSSCLYGIEGVRAPDLSSCSARSHRRTLTLRGNSETSSLIATSLPLGVKGHSPVSSGLLDSCRLLKSPTREKTRVSGRDVYRRAERWCEGQKERRTFLLFIPSLDSFSRRRDSCRCFKKNTRKS